MSKALSHLMPDIPGKRAKRPKVRVNLEKSVDNFALKLKITIMLREIGPKWLKNQ